MPGDVRILSVARRLTDRGWQEDVEEFVQPVVHAALRSAGLFDSGWPRFSVTASSDIWDGVAYSEQPVGEVLGTHYGESLKVTEDGLQALALAKAAIEAGETQTAIVLAHCIPSRHQEPASIFDRSVEPFWQRSHGLDAVDVELLVRSYWMGQKGWTDDDLQAWRKAAWTRTVSGSNRDVVRRQYDAGFIPSKHDMRRFPKLLDGAVAVVLGNGSDYPDASVRIDAIHPTSAATGIGEAPVGGASAFSQAVRAAVAEAGCGLDDIDLFELSDWFDYQAPLWMEAITGERDWPKQICDHDHGRLGGRSVNLSGGMNFWATPLVCGLDRLGACYSQLRGNAGSAAGAGIHRALAQGCSGLGGVSHTVAILSHVNGEGR